LEPVISISGGDYKPSKTDWVHSQALPVVLLQFQLRKSFEKYENTTQSTTLLTSRKQKMELQYYSDLTKKYDRNMSQMPWPVHTTRGKWKLVYTVGLTFKSPSFWPPMANAARDGWNLVCVAGLISSSSLWLRMDVVSKLVDSVPHISSHSPFEQIENI